MKTQKTEKANNFQIKNEIKSIKPDKDLKLTGKKLMAKKKKNN